MSSTPFVEHCDLAAYRAWRQRRIAPAYMRGLPSWLWQSAMTCRHRRPVVPTVT